MSDTESPVIEVYSKEYCPYCVRAKAYLEGQNLPYKEIDLSRQPDQIEVMLERTQGRQTVPQIFINGHHVGGYDDLVALSPEKLKALVGVSV